MDIQGYFTKKGLLLAAKLAAGSTLKITRVCAGAAETALSASALSQIRQTLSVGRARRSGETAVLPVTLEAGMAGSAYTLRELGVYAQDPDDAEILYKVYRLSEPVEISPASRLVLRFYLEETVSQDLNVTVVRASAGLLTEGDLEPLESVMYATRVPTEEITLAVEKLPEFMASLPRLLTKYYIINVGGTLETPLFITNFYGNGGFRIVADTREGCVFKNIVEVSNCGVSVQFWNMRFQQTEKLAENGAMLSVGGCRYVRVTGSEFTGQGRQARAFQCGNGSRLLVEDSKAHGWSIAAFAGRNAQLLITGRQGDYYDNTNGAYAWRGGIIMLDDAPDLLGGSVNLKQGGIIVSSNGTLL